MGRFRFSPIIIMMVGFVAIPKLTYAQEVWVRTYGGSAWDWGECVLQTPDGGYIVTGGTRSWGSGESDVWLLKLDVYGDTDWDRTYGGLEDDYGLCVHQTAGGYAILGSTKSGGQQDIWLLKVDSNGDTLWTKTYGGALDDRGYWFVGTSDSGFLITGETFTSQYHSSLWLIKTDSLGDTIWTKTYGGDSLDWGEYIQQTSDGGYIITGKTASFGMGQGDIWLLKTDSLGDTLWTRTYGGLSVEWGRCVQETSDGGYIVVGETQSFGAGWFDAWLLKTDSLGDTLWTRTYGDSSWDWLSCVQLASDGGYILAGETQSYGGGYYDVWLYKINAQGDSLWAHTFGGVDWDWGRCVRETSGGGYIIAGGATSFGEGEADLYLIKTDEDGYVSVEENLFVDRQLSWEVLTTLGSQITLSYSELPKGFHAYIFDASGRKVDELHSNQQAATLTWGGGVSPGVYFIRVTDGSLSSVHKVILIR